MKQSLLIKNAVVLDSQSPWNGQEIDIYVQDGRISQIGKSLNVSAEQVFEAQGSSISQGWMDVFGFCPDPGEEFKESLMTYAKSAQMGGVTHAAALCGTHPKAETASAIQNIIDRQKHSPNEIGCQILPLGLASEEGKGAELSDMSELITAGAIGLTDGISGGMSSAYMSKALEYSKMVDAKLMLFPFDKKMVKGAEIHEGVVSVNLGMKGIPVAAETSALYTMIEIAEWLNTPIVVLGVSSKRSVDIIKEAKARGVQIKAVVPVLNLQYNHEVLNDFDESFKVLPPLREETDRKALLEGLMSGVLDGVFSNHAPEDVENKKLEFAYAQFGAATLPSFAHLALNGLDNQQVPLMIDVLTRKNREILGLNCGSILEGELANFTIFASESYTLKSPSLAYNVMQKNNKCSIRVKATVLNGQLFENQ